MRQHHQPRQLRHLSRQPIHPYYLIRHQQQRHIHHPHTRIRRQHQYPHIPRRLIWPARTHATPHHSQHRKPHRRSRQHLKRRYRISHSISRHRHSAITRYQRQHYYLPHLKHRILHPTRHTHRQYLPHYRPIHPHPAQSPYVNHRTLHNTLPTQPPQQYRSTQRPRHNRRYSNPLNTTTQPKQQQRVTSHIHRIGQHRHTHTHRRITLSPEQSRRRIIHRHSRQPEQRHQEIPPAITHHLLRYRPKQTSQQRPVRHHPHNHQQHTHTHTHIQQLPSRHRRLLPIPAPYELRAHHRPASSQRRKQLLQQHIYLIHK